MGQGLDQHRFTVRMEWGLPGAEAVSHGADYVVVVDVLSFTTAVSVALDQRAEVFPYPWRDDSAQSFARKHRAVLAIGRSEAAAQSQPSQVSLSPASIRAAPGLDRIVLPSPNGSALACALAGSGQARALASSGKAGSGQESRGLPGLRVLAACLRDRTAVATWLASQPRLSANPVIIAVIAAGERWPDNSLRPAAEDLWGAGAVIAVLDSLGVTGLSPEARSAAAAWREVEPTLGPALAGCSSGAELADAGFSRDVAIAGELDASACVPLLSGGRFADAAARAPDLGC
jgi:2-phosphosulfolactate phosphatase